MNRDSETSSRPSWHLLLGALPADALPIRKPVAPPEVLASPHGRAVAGWTQLTLHLSAGAAGLRMLQVVLDQTGSLLSAGDAVLYRFGINGGPPPADCEAPALIHQESIGGRFEPDGSFHGTRWHSIAVDHGEDELPWQSTREEPTADDATELRGLAEEIIRRQPGLPLQPGQLAGDVQQSGKSK